MFDPYLKEKLKKQYGSEQVFVVPWSSISIPDRFTPIKKIPLLAHGTFIKRYDAEYSKVFLQPIPYVIIVSTDGNKYYTTKRLAGDSRFKNLLSLGCSGHISPEDNGIDIVINAALREMNEELCFPNGQQPDGSSLMVKGTLRDLSAETHEHFGIVFVYYTDEVKVKETETLEGTWYSMYELANRYDQFESWGKIMIEWIINNPKSI